MEDEKEDEEAKAKFEEDAAATEVKAQAKKAEEATEDTGEESILDAVNTDNLSDEVTP